MSWTTSDKQSIRESLGKGLLEIVNMENMADEGLNLTNMDEARVGQTLNLSTRLQ